MSNVKFECQIISESDVKTEYVTFRFVTRVTEKPVEPHVYIRNHSGHKRHTTCYRLELLNRRTNRRFYICLQHYKSSAYPKTLPRAGHYDKEAGVTGQDVSYRPWAENNPVTSMTSSNFQSALASTHQLSLIQYILSYCISKSLHPSSLFLLPGGFRSSTCLGYGLPTVLWSPLYIYCL